MADLLNKPVDTAKADAAAKEFVKKAASGQIGDDLVEQLGASRFHSELLRLSNEAEMSPWAFLDYVAEMIGETGHSAFNDVMLQCVSPKLLGLLMTVRYHQHGTQRNQAMSELRRDLAAMVPLPHTIPA